MKAWATEEGYFGFQFDRKAWFIWLGKIHLEAHWGAPSWNVHCTSCCWLSLSLWWFEFSIYR